MEKLSVFCSLICIFLMQGASSTQTQAQPGTAPASPVPDLQAQLNQLMEKRSDFIKKHDRERRLPALQELHKKLKNCQSDIQMHESKECKDLQREFGILTMSYFRSLSPAEKKTLEDFAKEFHTLREKAVQQSIQLTRQDFPFDLLFI